jgi:transcriptional regulator with XRE-family HTH domain
VRSLGARALIRVLAGRSGEDVAHVLGVSRQAVHAWASGKRVPSAPHRRALETHFGIDHRSWLPVKSTSTAKVRGYVSGVPRVDLVLNEEDAAELAELADGAGRSRAGLARELVHDALERRRAERREYERRAAGAIAPLLAEETMR